MEIHGMKLECTENGSAIYINNHIVDDRIGAKDYFWNVGFDGWKKFLEENPNYDWKKRHELIKEIRQKR